MAKKAKKATTRKKTFNGANRGGQLRRQLLRFQEKFPMTKDNAPEYYLWASGIMGCGEMLKAEALKTLGHSVVMERKRAL